MTFLEMFWIHSKFKIISNLHIRYSILSEDFLIKAYEFVVEGHIFIHRQNLQLIKQCIEVVNCSQKENIQ